MLLFIESRAHLSLPLSLSAMSCYTGYFVTWTIEQMTSEIYIVNNYIATVTGWWSTHVSVCMKKSSHSNSFESNRIMYTHTQLTLSFIHHHNNDQCEYCERTKQKELPSILITLPNLLDRIQYVRFWQRSYLCFWPFPPAFVRYVRA